jgi:hypothetical protein
VEPRSISHLKSPPASQSIAKPSQSKPKAKSLYKQSPLNDLDQVQVPYPSIISIGIPQPRSFGEMFPGQIISYGSLTNICQLNSLC